MSAKLRPHLAHPALALGSTVLWGVIEFVALCRSRWAGRVRRTPR